MAVRWLDDDQQRAWRAFIETVGDLTTALDRDLAEHGLSLGDYQVLVHLSEATDNRMRMCDLAEALQLSPSGLTRRLDGLVTDGAVERIPSPLDGRVMLAALTEVGSELLRATAPHHVESVRRIVFDHLDANDVAAMETIFSKMATGLVGGEHPPSSDGSAPDGSRAERPSTDGASAA